MPTYDYVCDACGHTFELFQSIKDNTKRTCPECKKPKLRRLIGPGAAIVFKGSGFYKTDYRSDAYNKAAKAEKPADSKSESSKGESKTKPEPKSSSEKKPKSEN
ncbi:MAG TPA: zinc ribbon domain-containing protein [Pirellulales bacterium]|jgi:putative FmdB family regulatory protein|nr:zinc ribbon domain-containing protein [Pirellulales bacterium]